jgi:hypothetical protein
VVWAAQPLIPLPYLTTFEYSRPRKMLDGGYKERYYRGLVLFHIQIKPGKAVVTNGWTHISTTKK